MKIDSKKVFCHNLKKLRKKYNFTQTEMAKRCNTTTYNIRLLEKDVALTTNTEGGFKI